MLADSPSNYIENQECTDFITSIPTVFDSTRVIDGKLGEYIVTLRKKGNNWFIGGRLTGIPAIMRTDFSFLPSSQNFKVTLIKDGINAEKQAQDYTVEVFSVNSGNRKLIHMARAEASRSELPPLSLTMLNTQCMMLNSSCTVYHALFTE